MFLRDESPKPTFRAIVFDVDGFTREWNVEETHAIEAKFELPFDPIRDAAFEGSLNRVAVTGVISDEQWRSATASRVEIDFGDSALLAVTEWSNRAGTVKREVLEYSQQLRSSSIVVLLTNATSRLPLNLRRLELSRCFDVVFNSSEIGAAKPSPEVFHQVSLALGFSPQELVFSEDTFENVQGAESIGASAHECRKLGELQE